MWMILPMWPTCRRRQSGMAPHSSVLVEIDCGAGRCGVKTTPEDVVSIARAIAAAPGLKFTGIQAYQGAMQHMDRYEDRKAKIEIAAMAMVEGRGGQGLAANGMAPDSWRAVAREAIISRATSGRLQRVAVWLLRLHGRRLWPDSGQADGQADRPGRVGERAVHPDQRDEPCQGRQGDLSMRA